MSRTEFMCWLSKIKKIVGIVIGILMICSILGGVGWKIFAFAQDSRQADRDGNNKDAKQDSLIAANTGFIVSIHRQALYDSIKESILYPDLQKEIGEKVEAIIKENNHQVPDSVLTGTEGDSS